MKKIEMTEKEAAVVKQWIDGEFDGFTANDEQKKIISNAIDDAEAIITEDDLWEQVGDDTLLWYYNQWKNQQSA